MKHALHFPRIGKTLLAAAMVAAGMAMPAWADIVYGCFTVVPYSVNWHVKCTLDGFTGALAGNILLDVRGTTTLAAEATIDPGIDLHLAPGAILDLGGRTMTVRNASGSGTVRNGTLVVTGVDSRMSPATVIIMR